MNLQEMEHRSITYRRTILRIIKNAGTGHTGGSLSCIDLINVLYNQVMNVSPENFTSPGRDRYIQSKGHSVEALYTVLADRGFFDPADLDTLCRYGSHYVGHPTRKVSGIEHNTGALGHGLSVGVGLALAARMDNRPYHVFVLLGDGELAEGSNWEAAMSAAHYHLDNLVVIVDRNRLQISGSTEEVTGLEPLAEKFAAFGFCVRSVDGHDHAALVKVFHQVPFEAGRPNLILAQTIKGKGIRFAENALDWHHHVPTDGEYAAALAELDLQEAGLKKTQPGASLLGAPL
jgi:transketolase